MTLYSYRTFCFALIFYRFFISVSFAQEKGLEFTSTDKDMEHAFYWAKGMALHYKGADDDPVGPWYEAALPSRYAFCMRDASHQSIGAEILGLSKQNNNIFTLFAGNISASKNWCSYWEINKYGKPAPEDYRNDKEFWYNLPANFDVLFATWRLYLWTGNKYYINDAAFTRFQQKTVKEYIDAWVLSPDSLLKRPAHPNAPRPYNENDNFDSCRGLPSYSEGVPNLKTGLDLVAALYRGLSTYSDILSAKGLKKEAELYAQKAELYRQRLEADWWNNRDSQYYAYYCNDEKFRNDEGGTFVLWFDALKDTARIKKTIAHIAAIKSNVENTSYLPLLFYKNGYPDQARKYILYLSDPFTPRREYPEVSFGVIEGIVQGFMGISPDARTSTVSTIFKMNDSGNATISNLSLLHTVISLAHLNNHQSVITNTGERSFKWKAMFYGKYKRANVNGVSLPAKMETGERGRAISYIEVDVKPGTHVKVEVIL